MQKVEGSSPFIRSQKSPAQAGFLPFDPSKQRVLNISHALARAAYVNARLDPPAWLDAAEGAPEYVALENGLLHMPTRMLHPHTPLYFSTLALPYAYDPDAPPPARWLQFLHELWADDEEMISTLAEIMGYVLGGGTSQQKIFLLVGPTRSGKERSPASSKRSSGWRTSPAPPSRGSPPSSACPS
jgi:putative DNA primase/helicase